jgi:hypothetical protein
VPVSVGTVFLLWQARREVSALFASRLICSGVFPVHGTRPRRRAPRAGAFAPTYCLRRPWRGRLRSRRPTLLFSGEGHTVEVHVNSGRHGFPGGAVIRAAEDRALDTHRDGGGGTGHGDRTEGRLEAALRDLPANAAVRGIEDEAVLGLGNPVGEENHEVSGLESARFSTHS